MCARCVAFDATEAAELAAEPPDLKCVRCGNPARGSVSVPANKRGTRTRDVPCCLSRQCSDLVRFLY